MQLLQPVYEAIKQTKDELLAADGSAVNTTSLAHEEGHAVAEITRRGYDTIERVQHLAILNLSKALKNSQELVGKTLTRLSDSSTTLGLPLEVRTQIWNEAIKVDNRLWLRLRLVCKAWNRQLTADWHSGSTSTISATFFKGDGGPAFI